MLLFYHIYHSIGLNSFWQSSVVHLKVVVFTSELSCCAILQSFQCNKYTNTPINVFVALPIIIQCLERLLSPFFCHRISNDITIPIYCRCSLPAFPLDIYDNISSSDQPDFVILCWIVVTMFQVLLYQSPSTLLHEL